jgi:DNA-binding SARP family transcriptional activator
VGDPVGAEIAYQRARLAPDRHPDDEPDGPDVAERMVAAADLCGAEAPNRAVAMLVDAAAWKVLADEPDGAAAIIERAAALATRVSSHAEILVGAVRVAVRAAQGRVLGELAEQSRTSLLIGQTERFPSSPEVALVIGIGLLRQRMWRQADRWAEWVDRCAEHSGDQALRPIPWLLRATGHLAEARAVEARRAVEAAVAVAEERGGPAVVGWAWALATQVHALTGDRRAAFASCTKLFAVPDRVGRSARLRAMPALALLELQQGRVRPALAWIHAVEGDLAHTVARDGDQPFPTTAAFAAGDPTTDAVGAEIGLPVAVVRLLAHRSDDRGLWAPGLADVGRSVDRLLAAGEALAGPALVRALVELCLCAQLVTAGRGEEAQGRLGELERWALEMGAAGIADLALRELAALAPAPLERPDRREAATAGGGAGKEPRAAAPSSEGGVWDAEWELRLLGGFEIRRQGRPVSLPPSLAAQAVKVVALNGRLTVDELVDHLWENAGPGVGTRRLRNVLWRVRSACGELVRREGNVLRLAPEASTDVDRFRCLVEAAAAAGPGTEETTEAARAALHCYRGELLPDDRYADWAAGARESVGRLYVGTLELLVDEAAKSGRMGEVVELLDRLAAADPHDERHLVRLAEVHLRLGKRGRALEALGRAERTLQDLGMRPSPPVVRLRETLGEI